MTIIMGGGNNPPVRLDPFQNIVNVGWGGGKIVGVLFMNVINKYYNYSYMSGGDEIEVLTQRIAFPSARIEGNNNVSFASSTAAGFSLPGYGAWPIPADTDFSFPPGFDGPARAAADTGSVYTITKDDIGAGSDYILKSFRYSSRTGVSQEEDPEHELTFETLVIDWSKLIELGSLLTIHLAYRVWAGFEQSGLSRFRFEIWRVNEGLTYPKLRSAEQTYPELSGMSDKDKRIFGPSDMTHSLTLPEVLDAGASERFDIPVKLQLDVAAKSGAFV